MFDSIFFMLVGLHLSSYKSSSSGRRRLVQSATASLGVYIVLQNFKAVSYAPDLTVVNGSVACASSLNAYNYSIDCPRNITINVACDGLFVGRRNYQCPFHYVLPKCTSFDGSEFSETPLCTVVSSTSTNTTCYCETAVQQEGEPLVSLSEFSAAIVQVLTAFASTLESAGNLNASTISQNKLIFTTMLTLACALFFGFIIIVRIDMYERTRYNSLSAFKKAVPYKFTSFLASVTPIEYSGKPWWSRLYDVVVVEHDWYCMFANYSHGRDYRTVSFIKAMIELVAFLFMDTFMSVLFFKDDGTCGTFKTPGACAVRMSLDQIDPLCTWEEDTCNFNENIGTSIVSTVVVVAVLEAVAIPLRLIFKVMLGECRTYCIYLFTTESHSHNYSDESASELNSMKSLHLLVLRAARLQLEKDMDEMTIEEEADCILAKQRGDAFSRRSLFINSSNKLKHVTQALKQKNPEASLIFDISRDKTQLMVSIKRAREKAREIEEEMETFEASDARNKNLLLKFFVGIMSPMKGILAKYIILYIIFFIHFDLIIL